MRHNILGLKISGKKYKNDYKQNKWIPDIALRKSDFKDSSRIEQV